MAVRVQTASIYTYLQRAHPMNYQRMLDSVLSGEMPQAYTTIKTKKQLEETLMCVLWARTLKACPLPREHSPVNWYAAPMSIDGYPFRFPWNQETLRKTIRASSRAVLRVDPPYAFKFIAIRSRSWNDPAGWARARPLTCGPDCLQHHIQHFDVARLLSWTDSAAQVRQRNLRSRMTMSGDMPLST